MSYEVDIKIQNLLVNNTKPPRGYLLGVDWLKTFNDRKKCSKIEGAILGKPLSANQRKKTIAKIDFFKMCHRIKATANAMPDSFLTSLVDYYFKLYLNKSINQKEFGAYISILNEIEKKILRGESLGKILKHMGADSIEEIESDRKFYAIAYKNKVITEKEYKEILERTQKREDVILFGGNNA